MTAKDLALSFDGKNIFKNVSMEIHREERIFIIGPNGCGKTSLLKTFLEINSPDCGEFSFGAGIDTGYYDQIQAGLHPEKTVLDEIWDSYPHLSQTEVRNALAVFLFKADDVFKPVSALSGGERARVLLLRLMLSRDNFLLLDEPTNHLDIGSCEALEAALQSYEGTLLIVSHDRYLINKIADRIYFLDENGATEYIGNYDDYLTKNRIETAKAEENIPVKPNEYKQQKERESAIRKEKSEMKRTELQIEQIENEIANLESELIKPEVASDYQAALELSNKLSELKLENDTLFQRWSSLAQKFEE